MCQGKRAGSDKKLYKSLEEQYQVQLSKSPDPYDTSATSPFGPLTDASSRKTLIFLISVLNATFPDYDFRLVGITNFSKLSGISSLVMQELSNSGKRAVTIW